MNIDSLRFLVHTPNSLPTLSVLVRVCQHYSVLNSTKCSLFSAIASKHTFSFLPLSAVLYTVYIVV